MLTRGNQWSGVWLACLRQTLEPRMRPTESRSRRRLSDPKILNDCIEAVAVRFLPMPWITPFLSFITPTSQRRGRTRLSLLGDPGQRAGVLQGVAGGRSLIFFHPTMHTHFVVGPSCPTFNVDYLFDGLHAGILLVL